MDALKVLSAIAGVLYVIGFVPYVIGILRKETKPAKASWLVWASLDTIATAGMFATHSINGQILGAFAGAWVIAILALKYGASGWTRLDKLCLIGSALCIVLWKIFDSPLVGLISSLVLMAVGSIPTFISAWKNPEHESRMAWTIFWISCVFAIIAIPHWTLKDAAQPIVFMSIETVVIYILYFKPKKELK